MQRPKDELEPEVLLSSLENLSARVASLYAQDKLLLSDISLSILQTQETSPASEILHTFVLVSAFREKLGTPHLEILVEFLENKENSLVLFLISECLLLDRYDVG